MAKKTYSFPATKKPYLGTITLSRKMPTVKIDQGKVISAPFGSLAKGGRSRGRIA